MERVVDLVVSVGRGVVSLMIWIGLLVLGGVGIGDIVVALEKGFKFWAMPTSSVIILESRYERGLLASSKTGSCPS